VSSTAQKFNPVSMNIELTTKCPLNCPQCYCSLTDGKDIDLQTAIYWLKEGGNLGVKIVQLSGGETLCYPHIYEIVAAAAKYCGLPNVALSGFRFTQDVYDELVDAGVGGIYISLNGSTEEINSQTRDGYDLAISALRLLHKNEYPNTFINWVMHSNNTEDFSNIIKIAEEFCVKQLVVMSLKPDSSNKLITIPSKEQMIALGDTIRTHKGRLEILVENCFSPMLALMRDTKLFGNLNVGPTKGCTAGLKGFSVNVDGKLSPCRHLEYFEDCSRLKDYWNDSKTLQMIRDVESNKREPCNSCDYGNYCRHCLAISSKIKGGLFLGNETCPLRL